MSSGANIRHLKRAEIDALKWDAFIDASPNGLVYAYSWYLDAMCDQWDALVLDDYAAVMPIPWRKKWGIKYVYTPAFVQQLGVMGKNRYTAFSNFRSLMHQAFPYGSYNYNFINEGSGKEQTNFVLDLSPSYAHLAQSYATDLKNNLKKASRSQLVYHNSSSFRLNIQMFKEHYADRLDGVRAEDFNRFEQVCANLQQRQNLVARHVTDVQNNIISSAVLLHAKSRLYLVMCTTTEQGRKIAAGHFLIDSIIREFAGTQHQLDFEGTDLSGVYHFYKNFNPVNQPYFFHHWNHLPILLRWVKK
ncbi:hypothetical protein [Pseudocnuella soli]|uniref:hypothetical protein n=1 Tax=Pseudocnuella soli TaxID=2502779 RepID=UPI00104C5476|nr:hypothetical protein [Pseudocnuella soli]